MRGKSRYGLGCGRKGLFEDGTRCPSSTRTRELPVEVFGGYRLMKEAGVELNESLWTWV